MASSLAGAGVEGLEDGQRGVVEVEDGGRGDQVEEGLAAGFEGVELALGEEGGVGDCGVRGLDRRGMRACAH